jgi:glycosyltransferase involved in cell wall biosynthesis
LTQAPGHRPTVALLPWGNVIEDFLDPLGLSLEEFCSEFTGSWMFSYADALDRAGVRTVLMCVSSHVATITRRVHTATGVTIVFLPPSRTYRWLLARMRNPYGRSMTDVFGRLSGWSRSLTPLYALLRPLVLYVATPPLRLIRALRQEQCDIVLCQEYEYPRFDVCVLVGRWLTIPVFASFQGGDYQRSPLERLIRPLAMRRCAGVVIGSKAEVERTQVRYSMPAARIAAIPNPIDTNFWVPAGRVEGRARLGIPSEARVVVWHGRVDMRKKGLDVLLDAWPRVCRHVEHCAHQPVVLLLIGSGRDDAILRQRIDEAGPRTIIWIRAFVNDRALLRQYLAAGDVYVFPSRHEGFPIAPVEAMSCGLPIVAADGSGIRDVLGDGEACGGVIVPTDDPEALAAALAGQLSNEARRREWGARARARVVSFVGADQVGGRLRAFMDRPRAAGARLKLP